ncbi:hypothetical protein As57867_017583, partial [Aphanomyces stellatus]
GLAAGTLSYGVAVLLMGLAYLCLALSMAEMTSMLPFAGGAYGLARCALSFYAGFIMGCAEAIEYIMYVTCSVVQLGRMLADKWPQLRGLEFLVWFAIYAVACSAIILGGKFFWRWNMMLALISLGIILVFCLGSSGQVNLAANGGGQDMLVVGGFMAFMKASPLSTWFFVGIEALNTLSNEVHDPKTTIPKGQVACMLTLLITSAAVFFVSISLPPGMPAVATALTPLSAGFVLLFNIHETDATLLSMPATFATIQGFILAYTNIIKALADSKLLPSVLGRQHVTFGTHVNAIVAGSALSFALCFLDGYVDGLDTILYNVCIFFGFLAYTSQCVGYIYLKRRYTKLERKFVSPVGIPGVVFAITVWVMNMVSIVAFQDDHQVSLIVAASLLVLLSLFYHCYAKFHQTFSEDERKLFFFAHVANQLTAPQHQSPRAITRAHTTTQRMFMHFNPVLMDLLVVPTALRLSTIRSVAARGSSRAGSGAREAKTAPTERDVRRQTIGPVATDMHGGVSSKPRSSRRDRRTSSIQDFIQHTHDSIDIWAVGITIVIGGQYFSWNAGLAAGTLSYGVAVLLMGLAYLCLALSMAEMTSMLPFAGGAYGLARCTLGFFVGFLVGCAEVLEYITYVACAMVQLGRMVAQLQPSLQDHLYLVWLVAYFVAGSVLAINGKVFWYWNKGIAAFVLLAVLVYCGLSVGYANMHQHAGGDAFLVVGGFSGFMRQFPLASWLYSGLEALNMLSNDVMNPKAIIPRGQIACILTLLVTSWAIFLITISLPPSMPATALQLAPLSAGFSLAFNITLDSATLLSIPATFATVQGIVMGYTNVLAAMATSKLLPSVLGHRHSIFNTPVNAIVVGSLASYGLCFVDHGVDGVHELLFNTGMLFGFASYTVQCVGYLFLHRHHNDLPRGFRSPVGVPGAVFAIVVWAVNILSLAFFQDDNHASLAIMLALVAAASLYYVACAKHRQTFSDDERALLLFAHVAKANNAPHAGQFHKSVAIAPQSLTAALMDRLRHPPKHVDSSVMRWKMTSVVVSSIPRIMPHDMDAAKTAAEVVVAQDSAPHEVDLMARLKDPDLLF